MSIKFDHQDFGLRINRSNVTSDYLFHNFSVWNAEPIEYKGLEFDVEFQNGHDFDFGDFNCPSNSLSLYLSNCDFGEELRELYDNDDEDFLEFLDELKDEAQSYLEEYFVTDGQEEKIIDYVNELEKEEGLSQHEILLDKTLSQVMEMVEDESEEAA